MNKDSKPAEERSAEDTCWTDVCSLPPVPPPFPLSVAKLKIYQAAIAVKPSLLCVWR